jgi:thymidylate kinase
MKPNGLFIQLDGIDGSGKSTLLNAALGWFQERGMKVFDVVAWSKENHRLPRLEEVGDVQILFTSEPTHAWTGKAIRDEIISNGTPYGARIAAQAFALDRLVQYRRVVQPFLNGHPERIVVQDRGLISSMAYQPLQSEIEKDAEPVTVEWLLSLDGNRAAMDFPPDAFVFLDVDAAVAMQRLAGRSEKLDNVRFEDPVFQAALAERYRRADVTTPFTERGTRLVTIDGGKTKPEVAEAMRNLLGELVTP